MPSAKLTKRAIDALGGTEKDQFIWDLDLRGFGMKITPAGSKTYVVQYRMGGRGSVTRRHTIGQHGVWTPTTAREEAGRILRLAASGVDPRAALIERVRLETELSFDVFVERFLADYGRRNWRDRTYASAESNMRRWIVPVLGRKALPAISRRDLTEIFDRLPTSSPALPRNLFALLRKLFAWAVERGDLERSPFEQMRSPPSVESRDRVLSDGELRAVTLCAGGLGHPFETFFRLLIITGQRRNEVAAMTWGELNRARCEWTLPANRTKNGRAHLVPLNDLALIELDAVHGSDQWPRSGYVFSTTGSTQISGYSKAKSRLDRAIERFSGAVPVPWRLHDLRRTFATNMQRLGVRYEVTEALLNHVGGARAGVAGVYQRHDWNDEKREAMDRWGDHLRALILSSSTALDLVNEC